MGNYVEKGCPSFVFFQVKYINVPTFCFILCYHGRGSGTFILPVGRQLPGGPVVPCKAMDTALNQNETELGILILAVPLQMLPDLDSLLDKHVQILWDFRCETVGLEDTDNLLSSNRLDLCNTIGITEDDTNLGWGQTFLGQFADVLLNIGRGDFEP